MKHWQQYNSIERLQLLDITSGNTGLPRLAIEKDWWVTMVLKALSLTQHAHLMSFKGGTSLSTAQLSLSVFELPNHQIQQAPLLRLCP